MANENVIIIKDEERGSVTYDCKGKTKIAMPCTGNEFLNYAFQKSRAKGNTLYVTIKMQVNGQAQDIELTFKNYNNITDVYCLINEKQNPTFPDDYETNQAYYDCVVEPLLVVNENKGKITGSNFDDKVTLENTEKVYTVSTANGDDTITLNNTYLNENLKKATVVKAGAGANKFIVSGSGNNLLTAGKDNDTFTFNKGYGVTAIKAGGGENTININDAAFGKIGLAEEKIKGTKNNIVFADDVHLENFALTKIGNELIISRGEAALGIDNYFATGKKYSEKTINGMNFKQLLDFSNNGLIINGSGTIKGTDYDDEIYSNDSISGKAKNDKIYAGKGSDIINAGDGKNSIYFYAGDGVDTVENGGGVDTLVFKKGSQIKFGHVKSETEGKYDLYVYYNKTDKSDCVILKDIATFDEETLEYSYDFDATSVAKLKVGSKTYKLEALLNRNKIENVLKKGAVAGTTKHDDIYVTDEKKFKGGKEIIISGNSGNDNIMIGSNKENAQGVYNVDPAQYNTVDIKPTVYSHTTDGVQDTTEGTYDKVASYAKQGGTYYAQSAISDIKVYSDGTDDTYHAYYNNQFTKLYDESGVNDVLNIKDKASGELKLIFTVSKDYKDWSTEIAKIEAITPDNKAKVVGLMVNSLQEIKLVTSDDRTYFLQNPDENNDIGIDIDYWGDKGLSENSQVTDPDAQALLALGKDKLAKFGGGIEKIVASDGKYLTAADINTVASAVAEWLNSDTTKGLYGEFDSVADVVESGNVAAIAAVVDIFDTNTHWQSAQG